MKNKSVANFIKPILVILLSLVFITSLLISIPYHKMNSVEFQNLDGNSINAKYSKSENGYGVLIITDKADDMSSLASYVHAFQKLGYGIFIFNLPSHGSSEGYLDINSNSTNMIAEQFYCAFNAYYQLSGLDQSKIHVIGFGSGARAILQTYSYGFIFPKSITLVGCDVNLSSDIQFDIINYSNDREMTWLSNDQYYFQDTIINIIYSTFDEISTKNDNIGIFNLLNNKNVPVNLYEVNAVAHLRLTQSARILKKVINNLCIIDNIDNNIDTVIYTIKVFTMYVFSLVLILYVLNQYKMANIIGDYYKSIPKKYIPKKILLWLPTFLITGILIYISLLLRIPTPVNIYVYLVTLSVYGALNLFINNHSNYYNHYDQKLFDFYQQKGVKENILTAFIFFIIVLCLYFTCFLNLICCKAAYIWILLYTIFLSFYFYMEEKEKMLIATGKNDKLIISAVNISGIILMFIVTFILGMFSNAIRLFDIIILIILFDSLDKYIEYHNGSLIINSIIKAFFMAFLTLSNTAYFMI